MIIHRELWQRTRPLFDELVELDDVARRARLDALGRTDPELRDAVAWLLSADIQAEAALREYHFGAPRETPTSTTNSRDPLGLIGRNVSHFRVTDYLASGGMGAVYTAEDLSLGRTVALKFPLPYQTIDGEVRERFVNEARSAATLDHPNLCTIHEIGESEHGVFLAMPVYPGETLKERLARGHALPPAKALEILLQVTTGLASAHAAGIVHRDLKPGNVMLLPDGTVKILDFGLAKVRDVSLTRSHMTLGTIGYMAPEQVRNGTVDARADLWAIGVMLYEVLTGGSPFRGEHEIAILHAVLHDEPPRPSQVQSGLSPAFDALIDTLLAKDPADRYQSAGDLLADLTALQRGIPLAFRTPFWNRSRRRRRLRKALLPTTFVLAAVVAGSAALYQLSGAAESNRSGAAASVPALRWRNNTTEIGTAAELLAALDPANAGRRVRLRPGAYEIDQPLTVPDSMTIEGAGVMQFDADSLPTGFRAGTETTVRIVASVGGDLLTVGDGVTVRNLELVDLAGRSGNVIGVSSRRPGDQITATIVEVVIVNPSPLTVAAGGPLGRGLAVLTRNLNLGEDPPPHDGSELSVRLGRSIIRSPAGGGGFFAYNFTAGSRISLDISNSVIGGSNEANGGVSRPEPVHDSEVRLESRGNLYRNEWPDPCASAQYGWNFTGGSGAPIPIPLAETRNNSLHVRSTNDRIEGFTTAVLATGSRRFFAAPLNPPPSGNHIDLQLTRTSILTPSCPESGSSSNTSAVPAARLEQVADLWLAGAWVENTALAPGDSNTVRAELRGVTGSGQRFNRYLHAGGTAGELPASSRGAGNRLEIVGTPDVFLGTNRGITPAPAVQFFARPR